MFSQNTNSSDNVSTFTTLITHFSNVKDLRGLVNENLEKLFTELSVHLETDKCLPMTGFSTLVQINKCLLRHLITEVVDNAIDGVVNHSNPMVYIQVKIDQKHIIISILDNGLGFSANFFEQLTSNSIKTTKSPNMTCLGGAGAGLTQVISAIHNQDGKITFTNMTSNSDMKSGASVEITLLKSKILSLEEYEIQKNLRNENKNKYFRYAYSGLYAPPVSNPNTAKSVDKKISPITFN